MSAAGRAGRRCARVLRAAGLVLAMAGPGAAGRAQAPPGLDLPVVDEVLDNGLRILVLPRRGAPTVAFASHVAVGSVHEHLGTTGTAHLLEHLLFKGTTTIGTRDVEAERSLFRLMDAAHDTLVLARAAGDSLRAAALAARIDALEDSARTYVVPNEFDRILTRAGARGLNATTTDEATIYYVELPANRAELWFALEADRRAHPVFREFYTERDVVMEERRMRVEASPGGALYEEHLAHAFTMHPYGVPVVGYMSDLRALSRRDVDSYFRRYYGPANTVVAVVGDIDPHQALAWARRYLGPLPAGEAPPPVTAVEPPQRGERRVEVEWPAEPMLRVGWRIPPARHDDTPALTVLSTLLTGGRTSRLHRRLVQDDRVATAVFSSLGPGLLYPRLFTVEATPRSPHTPGEVEAAVYEELERLAREGPGEGELVRVRNRVEAASVRRLTSNLGLAFQLTESAWLFGDWRETFRTAEAYRAVTAGDVRRVAARYFTRSNRTAATLVRSGGEP